MANDSLASSRVTHRADAGQIDFADELRSERRAARRVELIPEIEVMLNQLGPRVGAEVEDEVVAGIDAVRADRHDDVAVAGQDLRDVVVSLIARERHARRLARPFEKRRPAVVTGGVTAVEKN